MKTTVSDEVVAEYAERIRAAKPLGKLFPAPMSECEFTEAQRAVIRSARHDRKVDMKSKEVGPVTPASGKPPVDKVLTKAPVIQKVQKPAGGSKLSKMLYLQHGRCFFCGEQLAEGDASIEHLNPKSKGGTSTEDNEVVCHATLNDTFGNMDLKRKFEFTLRVGGAFKCPST